MTCTGRNDGVATIGLVLLTLIGCANARIWMSLSPVAELRAMSSVVTPQSADGVRKFIAAAIDGSDTTLTLMSSPERSQLHDMYQPDGGPLWVDAAGRPTGNAQDAIGVLTHVADEGLESTEYFQELLSKLMARVDVGSPSSQDLGRLDVAISAGMLRYLRDLHHGRVDPRTIGLRLDLPPDRHDFATMLRTAIGAHGVTNLAVELRPSLAQYRLLRSMLPRYRVITADPTFSEPQSIAHAVHPGDPYTDLAVLRRELIALGDLPGDTPTVQHAGTYGEPMVEGVKHFQTRHGLEPDGVLGAGTVAALRIPPSWRVRQIELALERLRWLPHVGEHRLVALNIPMFHFWAWDDIPPSGAPLFGMDAIVGRALRTQTPVFVAEMGEVVFRPYWNVPTSIVRGEVLPRIARDPDYLRRQDMEIVEGGGDNATRVAPSADALVRLKQGVLRLRQRPGTKNALGLIKFVFPNRDDVYMHGTPAQALFAKSRRDFSHGCVRVADPVALAQWVLKDRPEWTRDRILAATMGPDTIHAKLASPIQVILFYTTAAVMPEDGTIRFADDIYHHDARLENALAGRRRQ